MNSKPSTPSLSFRSWAAQISILGMTILLVPGLTSQAFAKQKSTSEQPIQVLDEPIPTFTATATPTTQPTLKTKPGASDTNSKTLVLHKPATDPAWGRVVEYHTENSPTTGDKPQETLYVFLFQDDQGVVRTAVYHESSSGDGYWEVLVWDR